MCEFDHLAGERRDERENKSQGTDVKFSILAHERKRMSGIQYGGLEEVEVAVRVG